MFCSIAGHSNSPIAGVGQSMKLRPLRELPPTVNSLKKLNAVYIEPAADTLIGEWASARDKPEIINENLGEMVGK